MIGKDNMNSVLKGAAFLLGSLGILAIMGLDLWYWQTGLIAEGWPDFSSSYIFRSISIFVFCLAILWGVTGDGKPLIEIEFANRASFQQLGIFATLVLAITVLLVFIVEPQTFGTLSLESGPVEWGSFVFLICGAFTVAFAYFKFARAANFSKFTQLSLVCLALVLFVIAMEEVSWFQRELGIQTPKIFSMNHQGEFNLHNFSTDRAEILYYFGTFIFLVALPFMRYFNSFIANNQYLKLFVARPYMAIIGSVACAYNFDMWNIIFTQIYFYSSVIILFSLAMFSQNITERLAILFTLFMVVLTQVLFLLKGDNFSRLWEVTEYKELFIPLALFIYSLDLFAYIKRVSLAENAKNNIPSDPAEIDYTGEKAQ